MPYITGNGGALGSIASNYGQYGQLSQAQLAAIQSALGQVQGQSTLGSAVTGAGMALLGSPMPNAQQVTGQYLDYSKLPTIGTSNVTSQDVDPSQAFSLLGSANPTGALSTALSGSVSSPYLSGIAAGTTASAQQQYDDLLEDQQNTLNFTTLPGLRTGAAMSGQYGGSRLGAQEGVAQGLVGQTDARAARDLSASTAATNAQMYGTAYDQAQDRAATVGQDLAGLGVTAATGNADRAFGASSANASNSLQASVANANQLMTAEQQNINEDANLNEFNAGITLQNNQQRLAQAEAAAGLLGSGSTLTGQNTEGQLGLLGYGANYAGSQLGTYAGLLGEYAGLGGTTNLTGATTNNTTGNETANMNGVTNGTSNTTANGTSNTTGNTVTSGFSFGPSSGGGSGGGSGGSPWSWLVGAG